MAWVRGRYYTRSKKVGGKVVREYVGGGAVGQLAAQLDAIERQRREDKRAAFQAERSEAEALDAALSELDDLADLMMRAALVAAGCRQHKRGEWRKQREQDRAAG